MRIDISVSLRSNRYEDFNIALSRRCPHSIAEKF